MLDARDHFHKMTKTKEQTSSPSSLQGSLKLNESIKIFEERVNSLYMSLNVVC